MHSVRFDQAFTFIYSKREGTPAATWSEQVDSDVVQARFERLVELQNEHSLSSNEAVVGQIVTVLVEGKSRNRRHYFTGRTKDHRLINFRIPADLQPVAENDTYAGRLARVRLLNAKTFSMDGEFVSWEDA